MWCSCDAPPMLSSACNTGCLRRRRGRGYQVRRYEPFLVAEAPLDPPRPSGSDSADAADASSSGRSPDPAAGGGGAFNALAGYIFGKGNVENARLGMTTPVITNSGGAMQFMIAPSLKKVGVGVAQLAAFG